MCCWVKAHLIPGGGSMAPVLTNVIGLLVAAIWMKSGIGNPEKLDGGYETPGMGYMYSYSTRTSAASSTTRVIANPNSDILTPGSTGIDESMDKPTNMEDKKSIVGFTGNSFLAV